MLEYSRIQNEEFSTVLASQSSSNGDSKMLKAIHYFEGNTMKTLFHVYKNRRHVSTSTNVEMAIECYNE